MAHADPDADAAAATMLRGLDRARTAKPIEKQGDVLVGLEVRRRLDALMCLGKTRFRVVKTEVLAYLLREEELQLAFIDAVIHSIRVDGSEWNAAWRAGLRAAATLENSQSNPKAHIPQDQWMRKFWAPDALNRLVTGSEEAKFDDLVAAIVNLDDAIIAKDAVATNVDACRCAAVRIKGFVSDGYFTEHLVRDRFVKLQASHLFPGTAFVQTSRGQSTIDAYQKLCEKFGDLNGLNRQLESLGARGMDLGTLRWAVCVILKATTTRTTFVDRCEAYIAPALREAPRPQRRRRTPSAPIVKLQFKLNDDNSGDGRFMGLEESGGQHEVAPKWITSNRYDNVAMRCLLHPSTWYNIPIGKSSSTSESLVDGNRSSNFHSDDGGPGIESTCTGVLAPRRAHSIQQPNAAAATGRLPNRFVQYQQRREHRCLECAMLNALTLLGDRPGVEKWAPFKKAWDEDLDKPTLGLKEVIAHFIRGMIRGYEMRKVPMPDITEDHQRSRDVRAAQRLEALEKAVVTSVPSEMTVILAVLFDERHFADHIVVIYRGFLYDSNKKEALRLVDAATGAVVPGALDACVVGDGGRCIGITEAVVLTQTPKKRKRLRNGAWP